MSLTDHPETHFLEIQFKSESAKTQVSSWLLAKDLSFVEGEIDGLNIDFDYDNADTLPAMYENLSRISPIRLYKFEKSELVNIRKELEEQFTNTLEFILGTMDTRTWTEGWKESFRPIKSEKFYIYPPWEQAHEDAQNLINICIEPGMAFGTGTHETTQLCLQMLETIPIDFPLSQNPAILDLGTGSGILTIACAKLGYDNLYATDIDADAIRSAQDNLARNDTSARLGQGSTLKPDQIDPNHPHKDNSYQLIIANILFPVLKRIMPNIKAILSRHGTVVFSGIITEQEPEFLNILTEHNFEVETILRRNDWVAIRVRDV